MSRRGSVLIIVLVTLVFAATALVLFMEKATDDLMVDRRVILAKRNRMEAYSALEVTLAVLQQFSSVDGGLHSPAEGWSDPLGFAGYTPSGDRTVDVGFEDESGKISLPHATADDLSRLFQSWQVSQADADTLADALMGWMKRGHVYTTPITPDYEQSSLPYDPPGRPLRSYSELAAIDKVRDFFYDSDGRPNDYWRRFVGAVSLYDFQKPNINGASPDALAALGQYTDEQQQSISDYLSGKGQYQSQGPAFFKNPNQAQTIAGEGGNPAAFTTVISALRIKITVHEGSSEFRLSAVVAPPNGARPVPEAPRPQTTTASAQTAQQRQASPNASQPNGSAAAPNSQAAADQNLRYPFTLLEIRENDAIPPPPPPPPTNPES